MPHKWDPSCPPPRHLVRPVPLDLEGVRGPTPGQAKGTSWRRTSHGFYVPVATVNADIPEQRVVEQAVRLPDGGAVTGWASLRMRGGNFFDGLAADGRTQIAVPLAVGGLSKMRGDERVLVSREPLDPSEVVLLHGVPCTVVRRALFDEMRRTRDLRESVVAMDMAAAALMVSVRQMCEYAQQRRSWRRAASVHRALELASERSRSPQESRTRMVWEIDAGSPSPLVNQRIWDLEGNLLGIADLLDLEAGLVGEFDGADHREATRHTRDISRQERFERHGLQVFRVTGLDLLDPARVVARIHFHRSRALFLAESERRWTVTPPRGWEREQTLDEYLEERDFHNRLHQEYERELARLTESRDR